MTSAPILHHARRSAFTFFYLSARVLAGFSQKLMSRVHSCNLEERTAMSTSFPRECKNRSFLWMLLVAAYGLANKTSKWQVHSDETFIDFGLHAVPFFPQLFFKTEGGRLVLIDAKMVGAIMIGGTDTARQIF